MKKSKEKQLELLQKIVNEISHLREEIHQLRLENSELKNNFHVYVHGSCDHEYPNPWYGTTSPHCIKCGKQAPQSNFYYGTTTGNPLNFDQFGGNMMYSADSFIINSENTIN